MGIKGRLGLALASGLGLCALLPAASTAATCGDDGTTEIFVPGGYYFDFTQASSTGPDRDQPFATLFDSGSNGPAGTPPGPRVASDTYDDWGALFVGGDALTNLYHSNDNDSCSDEDGGREHVYPIVSIGGLDVQRKIFLPATGMPGARILNLITNPGSAPVTTSIQVGDVQSADNDGDLGSDDSTAVRATSSGDLFFSPADFWGVTSDDATTNSDLALAHVIDGPGGADRVDLVTLTGTDSDPADNLTYRWENVTIPPGQTVAYMSFEVQQGVAGASAPTENANAAALADAYQNADPSEIYAGMSQAEISALRNWNDLELLFSFNATPKQKLKQLAVTATCPEEPCTVAFSGQAKAKPPKKDRNAAQASKKAKKFNVATPNANVTADQTTTIPIDLTKEGKLRKLLKKGAKSKLNLTAQATDAAGSTASGAATIKLKK
jgi:hypothetical protein